MNQDTDREQLLANLFRETFRAHHQAYIEMDGLDEEWPLWYAAYLHEKLQELLKTKITQSELVYLLVLLSQEQPQRAPDADWPTYYARFFVERYP